MQLASIYWREGRYFVHPSSRTDAGVWILSEPVRALDATVGDAELGRSIVAALDASRTDGAHPRSFSGLSAPILAVAGLTSWSVFAKGARLVIVERENGTVSIVPNVNLGAKGFEPLSALRITLEACGESQLGQAVRVQIASAGP
jgi:hypothetical protein